MMNSKLLCFVFLVCVSWQLGSAQFSPPKRVYGHSKGASNSTVILEVFLDIQCIYSKIAYQTMKQLMTAYGNKLRFVFHSTALYTHFNAFYAVLAIESITKLSNESNFWPAVDLFYTNQNAFLNGPTDSLSRIAIYNLFAGYALQLGIQKTPFINKMNDYDWNTEVKHQVDYASAFNRIWQTPTFLLNGVVVPKADSSWTLQQWQTFLDPYFQ